jgi:hypothetical protein
MRRNLVLRESTAFSLFILAVVVLDALAVVVLLAR